MKTTTRVQFFLPLLTFAFACGGPDMDVSETDLTATLELPNGGIDESDELPMFGDASFALLAESDEDPAARDEVLDEVDPDPAVAPTRPDTAKIVLTAIWGKLRFDPEETDVTDWSGGLSAEGAAIIGVRTIRFDARDHLLPRPGRGAVAWVSHTKPHHDGVAVVLRVPLRALREGNTVVHLRTAAHRMDIPLRRLVHHEAIIDVGDNKLLLNAFAIRPNDCASGVVRGHWRPRNADGVGHFVGRWMDAGGNVRGHVRGIYGERRNGQKVFFGKIINDDGRFVGRIGGRYGEGRFGGHYETRGDNDGVLRGRYFDPTDRAGGVFAGRWAETCGSDATTMPTDDLPPSRTR